MTKVSIKNTQQSSAALPKVKMTVKKVNQKLYRQYNTDDLFNSLLEFACLQNDTSMNAFLKSREKLAATSFIRYFKKSGLAALKEKGTVDASVAKVLLTKFFENTKKNSSGRTAAAHASCRYLTAHEEHSLVQLCSILGAMGYGLTRDDMLHFADQLVNKDVDPREHVPISKHVVEGILNRHSHLVKIVAAASLDPKRARQATEETRDAMFMKLNSYIEMLHEAGKIPWKHYSDIPSDCIYNMDELGNDTTKHRNKVIFKKNELASEETSKARAFMRTAEGDGRMPWHITVCLTTRADGMWTFSV